MSGRRGVVVVVAGPDGVGKTTVAEHVAARLAPDGLVRRHHRPHVLWGREQGRGGGPPVTEPHAAEPRPVAASVAKLLLLWLDHLAGWLVLFGPARRKGQHVLLERGWWDLAVDPRRYRQRALPGLVGLLGRLLPRPDATIVLVGSAERVLARSAELPSAELERQLAAWRALPPGPLRAHLVDADPGPEAMLDRVDGVLDGLLGGRR